MIEITLSNNEVNALSDLLFSFISRERISLNNFIIDNKSIPCTHVDRYYYTVDLLIKLDSSKTIETFKLDCHKKDGLK